MPLQDPVRTRCLTDLRRAQPADATLGNLLEVLSGKLKFCGRLAVFEYQAEREGHAASALAFRNLAEAERQSFDALVRCLKQQLDEAPSAPRGEGGGHHAPDGLP